MSHHASDRVRRLGGPISLYLLSTTMAAVAATGVAVTLYAAFDEESHQTVVCECACDSVERTRDRAPETDVSEVPPSAASESALPEAKVEGALDRDIIRRVVRAHVDEVRYCYNEGLQHDPGLEGGVVVRFTIGESGSVIESTLADSTLADEDVATCIVSAVTRWSFPKPEHGKVVVTYPFQLSPG
jgi:TonB family protein